MHNKIKWHLLWIQSTHIEHKLPYDAALLRHVGLSLDCRDHSPAPGIVPDFVAWIPLMTVNQVFHAPEFGPVSVNCVY